MDRRPGKPNPKTVEMCQNIFHRDQELESYGMAARALAVARYLENFC